MMSVLFTLFAFALALMILITVHEFGHFWVARSLGVKVLRFSIGFGKPLLRHQAKSGTEYVLSIFPLGGYVKMLDEREGEVLDEEKHRAFNRQPILTRIAVVLAGPLFNVLFAIAAYWLMFVIGITSVAPIIGEVEPGSIAAKAGLHSREEIVAVAKQATPSWQAVRLALIKHIGGRDGALAMKVRNIDTKAETLRSLSLVNWQVDGQKPRLLHSLGITPYVPRIPSIIDKVVSGEAADKAGLKKGDRVVELNGQLVETWMTFVKQVRKHPEVSLALTVVRNGKELPLQLTPSARVSDSGERYGYVGVSVKNVKLPEHMLRQERYNGLAAIWPALKKTGAMFLLTIVMLWKLVAGHLSLNSISGPVGIAMGAGVSASMGVVPYLYFLSLVSISLAVLNLLPVPILDGGHLLYYLVEAVTGRPVSKNVEESGMKIGLLLLVALMILAFYNDITRLLG